MIHPQRILRRPGIVLVEALVAISTLAMGVIALGTITQNAIGTTVLAKDYLVARGLAKEGEEAVKSIRYTNWMLKPNPDPAIPQEMSCWLRINPNINGNVCQAMATTGKYYIASLVNGSWNLVDKGSTAPNLDATAPTPTSYFRLYTNSNGYYPVSAPGMAQSKFFRSIYLTALDSATPPTYATYNVKVQWKDGSKTQEVNRTLTMYNYR